MTAQRPKEDVLVHYDECRGELVFFTLTAETTSGLRQGAFGGVRPSLRNSGNSLHQKRCVESAGRYSRCLTSAVWPNSESEVMGQVMPTARVSSNLPVNRTAFGAASPASAAGYLVR